MISNEISYKLFVNLKKNENYSSTYGCHGYTCYLRNVSSLMAAI